MIIQPFTGRVPRARHAQVADTQAVSDDSTNIATTEYVHDCLESDSVVPTQAVSDNSQHIATTEWFRNVIKGGEVEYITTTPSNGTWYQNARDVPALIVYCTNSRYISMYCASSNSASASANNCVCSTRSPSTTQTFYGILCAIVPPRHYWMIKYGTNANNSYNSVAGKARACPIGKVD